MRRAHLLAAPGVAAVLALLGACASPPPPAPPASIAELFQQPPERALVEAMRAYEEGAFDRAEASLRSALMQGLASPHDSAVAFKYLAFIACAFNRPQDCEQSFISAFRADPQFHLNGAEVGHPVWGPVYRRVAAAHGLATPVPPEAPQAPPPTRP